MTNRLHDICDEAIAWRRYLHQHPELGFEEHHTSEFVADKLRQFGFDEVRTGIAQTGVIGILKGRGSETGRIAFRADMDALPITEMNDVAYRSMNAGKMHACGHDGHTAMLLGAAKYLAETRAFSRDLAFIFQPAEETLGGARVMIEDGVVERLNIERIYALHNLPGLALGSFALRAGPIMAAADIITINIQGRGGHAAAPHTCIDPVVAGASIVLNLQTIVSRNVPPLEAAVISIPVFEAGVVRNVIPDKVRLHGTMRTLDSALREKLRERVIAVANAAETQFGVEIDATCHKGYPATINDPQTADTLAKLLRQLPDVSVSSNCPPLLASEDFSYFLERVPGAYVFIGNGNGPWLHQPDYDFNDAAMKSGMQFWISVAQQN